jgi:hypothetical protein
VDNAIRGFQISEAKTVRGTMFLLVFFSAFRLILVDFDRFWGVLVAFWGVLERKSTRAAVLTPKTAEKSTEVARNHGFFALF